MDTPDFNGIDLEEDEMKEVFTATLNHYGDKGVSEDEMLRVFDAVVQMKISHLIWQAVSRGYICVTWPEDTNEERLFMTEKGRNEMDWIL